MSGLIEDNAEQINGREGETATFIWRSSVSLTLRVIGFAPRHLSRSAFLGFNNGS